MLLLLPYLCLRGAWGGEQTGRGWATGNEREQLQLGETHKDHWVQLGLFSLTTWFTGPV